MLQNFIATSIRAELPFEPTEQQSILLEALGGFLMSTDPEKIFLLRGYAGTGKTSVVSALVRAMNALQQKTMLLAPTGRAAKVIAGYSGFPAFTIHKKYTVRNRWPNLGFSCRIIFFNIRSLLSTRHR